MQRALMLTILILSGSGCGILGPACLDRQERGTVATLAGSVDGDQVMVHRLSYDPRGSQNDVRIEWDGQGAIDGARLTFYATRVGCQQFNPAEPGTGDCQVLARAGWSPQGIASTLILTHGRGNPERLGTPPEYKLWITSDRATSYRIAVSYFFGPDC